MPSAPLVIDLSHHNTVIDFDAVRASGIVGVIHKATEGTGYSDEEYWLRRDEAQAAGLAWASYHFLRPGDVELQMQNFLQKVQPRPGEQLAVDFEDDDCSLDDLRQAISYLAHAAPSCGLAVYSGHLIKELLGDERDDLLATTALWIAQYTSAAEPEWPQATWPRWTLWQYTDTGQLPGIDGPVDLNRFDGSPEDCLEWFDPYFAEPVPEPEVEPLPRRAPTINIDIDIDVAENPDITVRVRLRNRKV